MAHIILCDMGHVTYFYNCISFWENPFERRENFLDNELLQCNPYTHHRDSLLEKKSVHQIIQHRAHQQ